MTKYNVSNGRKSVFVAPSKFEKAKPVETKKYLKPHAGRKVLPDQTQTSKDAYYLMNSFRL